MRYEVDSDGTSFDLEIQTKDKEITLVTESGEYVFTAELVQPGVYSVLLNNRSFLVGICDARTGRVNVEGRPMQLEMLDDIHLRLRELGWEESSESKAGQVTAQIPGLVTRIFHKPGDEVQAGEALFLMEAMKMENEIKSPVTGKIQKIHVAAGQTVEKGAVIIEIA